MSVAIAALLPLVSIAIAAMPAPVSAATATLPTEVSDAICSKGDLSECCDCRSAAIDRNNIIA